MVEFFLGDLIKFKFEIVQFNSRWYINLRQWQRYDPKDESDWKPTKKGLSIPLLLAKEFKKAIAQTLIELEKREKIEIKRKKLKEVRDEKEKGKRA